jgi:dihydrofolate reductase
LDWLFETPHAEDDGSDDGSWEEFIARIGPLVMGATTYEWMVERHQMIDNPQTWRDFYGDRPAWVFSHRDLPRIPEIDLRIVSGDVRPVFQEIRAVASDRDVWLLGGGDLVGQFDDAGLLDKVWLGMTPVTLGAGTPLLPRRITSERLTLRDVRRSGQRVRLILDVRRTSPAD